MKEPTKEELEQVLRSILHAQFVHANLPNIIEFEAYYQKHIEDHLKHIREK